MGAFLSQLIKALDVTVHPENRQLGGMILLRSRMLSLSCLMSLIGCSIFLGMIALHRGLDLRLFSIYLILGQSILILILNRSTRKNIWLAAALLIFLSFMIALGIMVQARSVFASAYLWFQVLIMPAFLLCGRRMGVLVSAIIMLVALMTVALSKTYGSLLPYEGIRVIGFRSLLTTILVINLLTLGIVAIYFHLLHVTEKSGLDQKDWLQRTARMQELLQMSSHFALKAHGPLDILGTALHNLEEPLRSETDARVLLGMLAPVESGINDLGSVAKSFSLFSRRYLEEGLEQTSFNALLQHVDTIYNVGAVLRRARLHWDRVNPDILIYTQTAKLVMLLISVLRRIGADGGTQLTVLPDLDRDGLHISISYKMGPASGKLPVPSDVDIVFDPELNEDLIQELCRELGMERIQENKGDTQIYRLSMLQSRCQARFG